VGIGVIGEKKKPVYLSQIAQISTDFLFLSVGVGVIGEKNKRLRPYFPLLPPLPKKRQFFLGLYHFFSYLHN